MTVHRSHANAFCCTGLLALCFFVLTPRAHAAVFVNEVAWMGTGVSANDEWIELYNDGSAAVDLAGWVLEDGSTLSIVLSGTVPAGSYFLLERTDDDTVPGVTAGVVYTGALGNDGRTLTLRRADGSVESTVVGGTNWESVGGDNLTKDTAQRAGAGWITAAPTPGAANATASSADIEADDEVEDEGESTGDADAETEDASDDGGGRNVKISLVQTPWTSGLTIGGDRTTHVYALVSFAAEPSGISAQLRPSLRYTWNFGDGSVGSGKEVTHRFAYPGTYAVSARAEYALFDAEARAAVTVLPLSLVLTRGDGAELVLTNESPEEMDISGYTIHDGSGTFTYPPRSYLLSAGQLTLLPSMLRRATFSDDVYIEGGFGSTISLHREPVAAPVDVAPAPSTTSSVSTTALLVAPASVAPASAPQRPAVEPSTLEATAHEAGSSVPPYVTYGGLAVVIMLGLTAIAAGRVPQ